MSSMRKEAEESREAKMASMGLKIRTATMGENEGDGHVLPASDGTQGSASGKYADGYESQGANERSVAGKKAKRRLDRKGYKRGGSVKANKKGTTVNVIVAPTPPAPPAGGPAMPPGGAPKMPIVPPPMPPGGPGGMPGGGGAGLAGLGGGAPPPMMPGRKRGGRVTMKAGAGSGEGRLEKIKEYGLKQKKGQDAPKGMKGMKK